MMFDQRPTDSQLDSASGFSSRRPAASGLPHFQLPNPEVPRVTSDGASPSPGVNTGSSQSSIYYPGHVQGSWPTPGSSQQQSAYTYTNGTSNQGPSPLGQAPYQRPHAYSQVSPSVPQFGGRPTASPVGSEGLQNSSSYGESAPYSAPLTAGSGGGGGSGGTATTQNPVVTQPPTTGPSVSSGPSSTHEGATYRAPQPSYYPSSSAPQQHSFPAFPGHPSQPSPTAHSPTTTGPGIPRGLSTLTSGMQPPPIAYASRPSPIAPPMASYASYPTLHGPVMSNMHQPGAPLTMVTGMHGMPQYTHHLSQHGMYMSHGAPPQQAERPFKCDQCPQSFNRNHDLKRHKRIHLAVKPFPCGSCDKSFSRKDALKRHRLVKGCGDKLKEGEEGSVNGTNGTNGPNGRDDSSPDQGMTSGSDNSPRSLKKEC
ncbi:hypothetical protein OQA88_6317 [Cercophora sp. LCS_1]